MVPENILSQPSAARLHHRALSKHRDQGDCPGGTQHTQLQAFAFLWHPRTLAKHQVHTMTHYLPHLANICCDLFIKIRGKLVLFPLERLFYMISLLPLDLPPLLRDGNCVEFKLALFLICWRKQRKPGESHALCWV